MNKGKSEKDKTIESNKEMNNIKSQNENKEIKNINNKIIYCEILEACYELINDAQNLDKTKYDIIEKIVKIANDAIRNNKTDNEFSFSKYNDNKEILLYEKLAEFSKKINFWLF